MTGPWVNTPIYGDDRQAVSVDPITWTGLETILEDRKGRNMNVMDRAAGLVCPRCFRWWKHDKPDCCCLDDNCEVHSPLHAPHVAPGPMPELAEAIKQRDEAQAAVVMVNEQLDIMRSDRNEAMGERDEYEAVLLFHEPAGRQDYYAGLGLDDCRWVAGTKPAIAWARGWRAARDKHKAECDEVRLSALRDACKAACGRCFNGQSMRVERGLHMHVTGDVSHQCRAEDIQELIDEEQAEKDKAVAGVQP